MPDADYCPADRAHDKAGGKRGPEEPGWLVFGELEEGEDGAREEREEGGSKQAPRRDIASAHLAQGKIDAARRRADQQQMDQGQIVNHAFTLHGNRFN